MPPTMLPISAGTMKPKTAAAHVDRLSRQERGGQLLMDESSRSNLEVLKTLRDGARKGSLLGVLDRTATSMGGRKLARWLASPLASLPEIEARLDSVEELSARSVWREELTGILKEVGDLERLCGRLSLGAGNARDLRALALSLELMPKLGTALASSNVRPPRWAPPPGEADVPRGHFIGAEVNAELKYTLRYLMTVGLHTGYMFRGNFYDGATQVTKNPFAAFTTFTWYAF
jgi:DNA mismatch repair ATPase MutS